MENLEGSLSTAAAYKPPSPLHEPQDVERMETGNNAIIRFPDGTAVYGPKEEHTDEFPNMLSPQDFEQNIALFLNEQELRDIGHSLKNAIEEDIGSQQPYFDGIAELLEYMGLQIDTQMDDTLPFVGASSIYSPALFESLQDIVATARCEIFKSTGMVDSVILGQASDQAQEIAARKKEFYNYYFDCIAKEFRKEALRAIAWAAASGSIYKKVYICPVLNRPVSHYIPVNDFIVNREHSSHMAATRKTHILRMSAREFDVRVMMGMYRDINTMKQEDMSADDDSIQEQLSKISGVEENRYIPEDAGYVIYECHVHYRIKGDPVAENYNIPLPYIITLDEKSGNVLSIYRNWHENDVLKEKKEYFVNYSFLTSFDGEGYGFVNYAKNLAIAATATKRQLINSAIYANFPGGVYQAGIRLENNNLRPSPGEFVPIQTGGIPIRDAIEALPYKEPSQALQVLNEQIEESIKRPSAIAAQKIADIASRAPMGSVLAMLDNLHRVPNAILQGFHESFGRELELFDDRFAEWLPPGKPYPFSVSGGDQIVMKDDFTSNIKVIPSSDPSTKNSTHRLMLSEILLDKAVQSPTINNLPFAYKYFYKNLGVSDDDINQLLTPHKEEAPPPQPMDPVSTIMALTEGKPTVAAAYQDHDAYIAIIDLWINANLQSPNVQNALALKQQHEAFKYMVDTYAQLNMAPPADPSQLNPDQQNQLAVEIAHIKLQEAQQAAAATTPPEPPLDPARVELEAIQMQAQMAHEKHEIDFKRLELDAQKIEMEYTLKQKEFDLKTVIQQLKQQLDQNKSELDFFKASNDQALKERDLAIKEIEAISHENEQAIQQEIQ